MGDVVEGKGQNSGRRSVVGWSMLVEVVEEKEFRTVVESVFYGEGC